VLIEVGLESGRSAWPGCFLGRWETTEALDVDGDGGQNVLEVDLALSSVAAAAHAVAMGELVDRSTREVVHRARFGQGWHWLLVNRATISGAAVGEEVGQGPCQPWLICTLGASDLLAVVVDVEVVPGEAFASAVLPGGIAPERPGNGDLVIT
jgi:hypothetical protein